ncbi:MAG: aldo/keto reductase [Ruminococcaceae bacterium]|nr:aldo/keto reductase [Oscillospiraceae bacterium]
MEYITLKNSDLSVSRFCMGGCPMGGYGWGETNENNFLDAIDTAIGNGVNFFDTADTYGLGQSELTLAKGLKNRRNNIVIQSKFGVRIIDGKTVYDNSPQYMREALEKSLTRLNTDYIDIYVIHYRDDTPIEEVVNGLKTLQKEGKIRYFGLSNIQGEKLSELLPYKNLFVNFQNEYSLACRKFENDIQYVSNKLNATPLTWGSLGQGILTGKYDINTKFDSSDRRSREIYVNFHGEKLKKNLEIVEQLKVIAQNHGKTVASTAIRFILDNIQDSVVIAGVKNKNQMLSNLEALDWSLTKKEIEILNEVSL